MTAYTKTELAASARMVLGASAYQTAISKLRDRSRAIFESRTASEEDVREARHMVWLLNNLAAELQSLVDDAAMEARRNQ